MQKTAVFCFYVIFWDQSGQAGVENGAMLTTYLFRHTGTSECNISWSNFQNFLRLRRQSGTDPPNQNPADVPAYTLSPHLNEMLQYLPELELLQNIPESLPELNITSPSSLMH